MNPSIRVLLVEDNPGDARLIRVALHEWTGGSCVVDVADHLAGALLRLEAGGIDILLLDLGLPDSQGPDTFAAVQRKGAGLPIILVTGTGDEEIALELIRRGAQDYIVKGKIDAQLLGRSMRYAIERANIMNENRRLNETLERRVIDRTRQLEAANRELETFTYSVSHDLRAPLRHIDGFARLVRERAGDTLDPTSRHYMDSIHEGTQQMGQLIDDLLHLAQVGRQVVRMGRTKLDTIVQEALAGLDQEPEKREIRWTLGPMPEIECDAGLMRIVFMNLLSNAVKYTRPRRQAHIEVAAELIRGRTVLYVRDNGVGFKMKYADKLFGAFQRLHRADEFEGTGIGLATVQRIVHKHGGEIWAESDTDQGATFYFTIGEGRERPDVTT
ncbi:MAG: ATP-binding protein [Gemmatimonadota bacterium]